MTRKLLLWCAPMVIIAAAAALGVAAAPAEPIAQSKGSPAPDKAAVERARKTVRMLDEVYKNAIVLITDKYVHSDKDFAAGSAAVALFQNVSKSGYQQVRLIDVSGEPYEPNNVAKDEFEKEGAKRIKAGEAFYDQVVEKEGKPYLRAMTTVPVVMQKCVMCHAHYEEAKKKGEAIGAISYTIPIE
jgi:hypothetical protein